MYNAVILIVDDEQTYLDAIAETLNEKNFKIVQALNGKMGCMVAEKFIPDIIIVDWEMPEMNGIEMIAELKKNDRTKDIPVIMCTGIMTSSKNLDTALNAGAIDYIRKPVDPIEITARINSALKIANAYKEIKSRKEQIEEQKLDIEQKNKELVELNATKDKLFSIIGHDLRGPIGGFKSFIEFMISSCDLTDTEEITKLLILMQKSAGSTYELLENLLIWAKSQQNEIVFAPKKIILKELVLDTIQLFNHLLQDKQIEIIDNIPLDFSVLADKNMLETVLRNLISNSIKFTPRRKNIYILVDKNATEYVITVKDEGIGIKPDDISKLFKKNEHFTTYGTNNEKGSGLGLMLCKDLVERHNERIWVVSEVGKGSEFKFTMPLCQD
ncbi:MAG: hybrid sensor histidine kinase/response regulator [Bacteroidia bacterium]|nr:hybrid sensor histidine kinase/response regulator [Bacteroidia bacterium]